MFLFISNKSLKDMQENFLTATNNTQGTSVQYSIYKFNYFFFSFVKYMQEHALYYATQIRHIIQQISKIYISKAHKYISIYMQVQNTFEKALLKN